MPATRMMRAAMLPTPPTGMRGAFTAVHRRRMMPGVAVRPHMMRHRRMFGARRMLVRRPPAPGVPMPTERRVLNMQTGQVLEPFDEPLTLMGADVPRFDERPPGETVHPQPARISHYFALWCERFTGANFSATCGGAVCGP